MAGNQTGGRKTALTNKSRYGLEFYRQIGRMGGLVSKGGGFSRDPKLAADAGRKGGTISKRGPAKNKTKQISRLRDESGRFAAPPLEAPNFFRTGRESSNLIPFSHPGIFPPVNRVIPRWVWSALYLGVAFAVGIVGGVLGVRWAL